MSEDRIYQAYIGEMGNSFKEKTHKRINWILEQSLPFSDILDIGCSQGVVPFLLGKSNKRTCGIDINEAAISYAQNLLETTYSEFKDMVTFKCIDFYVFQPNKKYDCIIITEVLEHLINPNSFLEKVEKHLLDNGSVVITVPFGLIRHSDHIHTFYMSGIYELVANHFDITDMNFMGEWIGIHAKHKKSMCIPYVIDNNAIKLEETNFLLIDTNKTDKIEQLQNSLDNANTKYRESVESYSRLKDWHTGLSNRNTELLKKDIELLNKSTELLNKNAELLNKNAELSTENFKLSNKNTELSTENFKLSNKNTELSTENFKLSNKNTELSTENSKLSNKNIELFGEHEALLLKVEDLVTRNQKLLELNNEYAEEFITEYENINSQIALLDNLNKIIQSLNNQAQYLTKENQNYRNKLALITDTWYGELAIRIYRILKRIRNKIFMWKRGN